MKIKAANPPATQDAIVEFERLCGSLLPADYRDFLHRYNGGSPEPDSFAINPTLGDGSVRAFYGLHGGAYSLAAAYRKRPKRFPLHLVPIGEDDCGNLICLSLSAPNCVSFFDHETNEHHPIATSFSALTESLHPAAPVQLRPGQVKSAWIDPDFLASLNKPK